MVTIHAFNAHVFEIPKQVVPFGGEINLEGVFQSTIFSTGCRTFWLPSQT
jgi:hypothetical protein